MLLPRLMPAAASPALFAHHPWQRTRLLFSAEGSESTTDYVGRVITYNGRRAGSPADFRHVQKLPDVVEHHQLSPYTMMVCHSQSASSPTVVSAAVKGYLYPTSHSPLTEA